LHFCCYSERKIEHLAFIELVNSENSSILRKKILLKQGEGVGEFEIQDNLPTGLNHILAYTNWMKNFGELSFFKKEMIIVNPNQSITPGKADSIETPEGKAYSDATTTNNLKIIPDKNIYSTRQQVKLKIDTKSISGKATSGNFSVSVSREEPQMVFNTQKSKNKILIKDPDKIIYLPDYKGIRLAGKLLDASDNSVAGAIITESVPGPGTNIKRSRTDSSETFHFLLNPNEGEQEIVFTLPGPDKKISLEEPFWNGIRDLPANMIYSIDQEAIA
jgi:hypothetical protein